MSSKGYATPLALDVHPNKLLRTLYLLFVLQAGAVLLWLPLPFFACALVFLLFLIPVRMTWQKRPDLGGTPVRLVWDEQQRWWWSQGGETIEFALQGESYVSSSLVVLCFRQIEGKGRRSLVLTPRSVGMDTFRRLLVRFRVEGGEAITSAGDMAH